MLSASVTEVHQRMLGEVDAQRVSPSCDTADLESVLPGSRRTSCLSVGKLPASLHRLPGFPPMNTNFSKVLCLHLVATSGTDRRAKRTEARHMENKNKFLLAITMNIMHDMYGSIGRNKNANFLFTKSAIECG